MQYTKEQIVALAQRYLEPHQPQGYRIRVLPEGVREDEGWWSVVIEPNREDVRSYDLSARLVEAMKDAEDAEGIHILYTTVMPQHAE